MERQSRESRIILLHDPGMKNFLPTRNGARLSSPWRNMSNIRHRRVGISGSLVLSSLGSGQGGEEKGEDARRRSFNDPQNFREEKIPPGACSQSLSSSCLFLFFSAENSRFLAGDDYNAIEHLATTEALTDGDEYNRRGEVYFATWRWRSHTF